MGGVPELGIFCGFVALYLAGSMPLIARHQKFQGEFFDGSMRSFGTLENTLRLWRESKILGAAPFLHDRYAQGRLPVEAKLSKVTVTPCCYTPGRARCWLYAYSQ